MARQVDDWIESYLQYTDNSEPPKLYREWVAISVIASVLERKCYLEWGELTFYPNLYIVLVGPSGKCRKGTAMGVGASMLRERGIPMAAEAITREALIRELRNATQEEADAESGNLYFHASLTIFSQELTVFLGYNNLQLMSDITDWYDCRDHWTYRTKNMGTDEITGVWVNLIGATTPELIRSTLPQDAIGGGLSSRIIFVYEEEKGKTVAAPFLSEEDQMLREKLTQDLESIHMLRGRFDITEEFLEKWIAWYEWQDNNPPFHDPNFQGYVNRRPNHILKLCMVMSASSRSDMVITGDIFDRALGLLRETEKNMPKTFSGYGRSARSEVMSMVMTTIAMEGKVTRKQLLKKYHQEIDDSRQLDDIIAVLSNMDFCKYDVANGTITYNPDSGVEGY